MVGKKSGKALREEGKVNAHGVGSLQLIEGLLGLERTDNNMANCFPAI